MKLPKICVGSLSLYKDAHKIAKLLDQGDMCILCMRNTHALIQSLFHSCMKQYLYDYLSPYMYKELQ